MNAFSSRLLLAALAAALLVGCATTSDAGPSAPASKSDVPSAEPSPEHLWLKQLLGTWEVTSEADMGPDADPMTMTARETVRAIGDLWIQSELVGDAGGVPIVGISTVGYDPEVGHFLGTWIDNTGTHMWIYEGRLDASGKRLELDSVGPDFEQPGKTRRYRDATEILAPGHRRSTSSAQNDDGSWTTFMTGVARRVGG